MECSAILSVLIALFSTVQCQYLGSAEYCTDLNPQQNINVQRLSGTWFGAEVITHRNVISEEKSSRSCIRVDIMEISQHVSGKF